MNAMGCSNRADSNWKPNSNHFQRRRINLPKTPNSAAPIRPTTRRSPPIFTGPPLYTPLRKLIQETPSPKSHHISSFIHKLTRKGPELSPLNLLEEDGDWSKDQFWAVIEFLKQNSRFEEISEVFDAWMSLDRSRASELNYKKMIGLLCEMGLVEEAVLALEEMKSHGFEISLMCYNSIVHGYANKGQFEDALLYLNGMQDAGMKPNDETYDGLIEAYGKFSKYDEMVKCFDLMKSSDCSPDHVTYNLMIREFSKGGLLSKMEKTCQALVSKRMDLQNSTLAAMIEAYVNFGIMDKMEGLYHKAMKSKTLMKEELIRKIAKVYIENYMFSRLDELGEDLRLRKGRTRFYWCLKLLSHACLLSKKGMYTVLREMEEAKVPWDVSVGNILLLALLKMKDLKLFKSIHSQLPGQYVVPDIVTLGILFDAKESGFDWARALKSWEVHGYLDRFVEMNTDPLVLVAFGKGHFLTMFEETYSSIEPQAREKRRWTYQSLIDFVLEHNSSKPRLTADGEGES